MRTGIQGSTGPGVTPITPANQPFSKTATVAPSAPPMLIRFMTAACTGITSDRKMTNSSSADSTTTMPMNSGSFVRQHV